jgi:4-hydroxy-3-polyprenylbenzoate decarboxylase
MTALAEMGAIIAPPVPAFYSRPDSLADMVDHTVGRVLDLFDIDVGAVTRWGETAGRSPRPVRAIQDQDAKPATRREKP